jgi:hypothetical protein
MDFNGDGTVNDLVPGTTINAFGRGLDKNDLVRLVGDYNRQYAGRRFGAGNVLARELNLPGQFSLGDNFFTQDLRASRSFPVGRRATLSPVVDVFKWSR